MKLIRSWPLCLHRVSFAAALITLGAAAGSVRADQFAYAVATDQNLYNVDLTTATPTLVGNTGKFLEGLAMSPTGALYGTDDNFTLYSLDPTTGAATAIGSTGLSDIEGLVFDGTTLLATNSANTTGVYSLDPATAAATLVTTFNESDVTALTLQSPTTLLAANGSELVSVSLPSGSSSVLGALSPTTAAIGFGTDGVLYSLAENGNEYVVNPTNGTETLVGSAGGFFYLDMTGAAIPEPGTVAILGAGLVGFGLIYRHSRFRRV